MDYNLLINGNNDRHQKLMEVAEHHRLVKDAKKHASQQQVSTTTNANVPQTYLSRAFADLYENGYMSTAYDYTGYFPQW